MGTTSLMVGERGSMDRFSCIEDTIFSRSSGRSRLSLHLLDDRADGLACALEGEMVMSEEESSEDA